MWDDRPRIDKAGQNRRSDGWKSDAYCQQRQQLSLIHILLVPLFISAFRRANDLAMAMQARCYRGGDGRTKMKPLHYESRDHIAYAVVWGYLVLMIVFGRLLSGTVIPF